MYCRELPHITPAPAAEEMRPCGASPAQVQGPPGLRGSNDCTSPLPDAVHQVGICVQEHGVAVIPSTGTRWQPTLSATYPESVSKMLGAGYKGAVSPSGLLGTPAGPDAVKQLSPGLWSARASHRQRAFLLNST